MREASVFESKDPVSREQPHDAKQRSRMRAYRHRKLLGVLRRIVQLVGNAHLGDREHAARQPKPAQYLHQTRAWLRLLHVYLLLHHVTFAMDRLERSLLRVVSRRSDDTPRISGCGR